LDCRKKDIVAYCRTRGLEPRIDQTNLEVVYTRNKIRLELIPYLEAYNPNITDTMIRMGKSCSGDKEFLWETALEKFGELCKERGEKHILLDGAGLRSLHRSIRQRVLSKALSEIGLQEDLTYAHFAKCEEIIFHDHPSARTDLPKGYCLAKNYDDIKVFLPEMEQAGGSLRIRQMSMEAYRELELDKKAHAAFDADQMASAYGADFAQRIALGTREAGDTIAMEGGKRKKIQDYFVDRKIPKDQRDQVQLVKIGHDVLWATPYEWKGRFCSKFKLCPDTKNVICIEIICDL
jgi:tRNA(Ile)-lysidine synthase